MAMRLIREQRVAAVKIFYLSNGNAAEASRRLSQEFNIPPVQGRNIKSIVNKFKLTGSVADVHR